MILFLCDLTPVFVRKRKNCANIKSSKNVQTAQSIVIDRVFPTNCEQLQKRLKIAKHIAIFEPDDFF